MKLRIATPFYNKLSSGYMDSISCLRGLGVEVDLRFNRSSYLPRSRDELIGDLDFDKITFIDSDMGFGPEHIKKMLTHNYPLVSGVYKRRKNPQEWVCGNFDKENPGQLQFMSSEGNDGLKWCDFTGGGLFQIDRSEFERKPRPWFNRSYVQGNEGTSEDISFCMYMGKRILVDCGVEAEHLPEEIDIQTMQFIESLRV